MVENYTIDDDDNEFEENLFGGLDELDEIKSV